MALGMCRPSIFLPSMKNKQAVKELPKLKAYEKRFGDVQEQIEKLSKEEAELERKIDQLGRASEVYKGVALQISEWCAEIHIRAVGQDIPRRAKIYRNPDHKRKYGLKLFPYSREACTDIEIFCGQGWKTKKAAIEAGKDWVAKRIKAKWNGTEEIEDRYWSEY